MITEKQYKIAIMDLETKFGDVLYSQTPENCKVNLTNFKRFIDSDEIIKNILSDILENNTPIEKDEFMFNGRRGNSFYELRIPQNKEVYIATIYETLRYLCEEEAPLLGLAITLVPGTPSKAISDKVKHFVRQVFMPLFKYIYDALEKGRISVEENTRGNINVTQTITGSGNTVVFAGRDSIINGEILKEKQEDLKSLIQQAMNELNKANIDEEEKEELFDDLQELSTEIENTEPKGVKFRKIKKRIDSFIDGADETLKKSTSLIQTLLSLGAILSNLL